MSGEESGGSPLVGRAALGLAVVVGRSMEPTLSAGDRLLVSYRRAPRVGDVVLVRFVDGTLAVKRAVERRADRTGRRGWWVLSDNPAEGVDSRHRGVVVDEAVVGVVRCRVWPRPRPVGQRSGKRERRGNLSPGE